MTKISEAAKREACRLANAEAGCEVWAPRDVAMSTSVFRALTRVLQDVSDKVKVILPDLRPDYYDPYIKARNEAIRSLILSDDPDPLEELAAELCSRLQCSVDAAHRTVREALLKRGLKITKIEETDNG